MANAMMSSARQSNSHTAAGIVLILAALLHSYRTGEWLAGLVALSISTVLMGSATAASSNAGAPAACKLPRGHAPAVHGSRRRPHTPVAAGAGGDAETPSSASVMSGVLGSGMAAVVRDHNLHQNQHSSPRHRIAQISDKTSTAANATANGNCSRDASPDAGCGSGLGSSPSQHQAFGLTSPTSGQAHAPVPVPRLHLLVEGGPLDRQRFVVGRRGVSCGRNTSNTIVLPEAHVSRAHFRIDYRGSDGDGDGEDHNHTHQCALARGGCFVLTDVGSQSGTFFFLSPDAPFALSDGTCVKAGETEFTIALHMASPVGGGGGGGGGQGQNGVEIASPQSNASGMPLAVTLTFVDGPLRGTRHTISRSTLAAAPGFQCSIGRGDDNGLVIPTDRILSTRHCAIVLNTSSTSPGFAIADLHSTNGTGIRLAPPREKSHGYPLTEASLFGCGVTKFIVEAVELDGEH